MGQQPRNRQRLRRPETFRLAYRPQPQRHSCATRSSAWEIPLSENVSVVAVPLEVWALITASGDLRMASTSRVSSAAFLTQAPSFWVYIGKPPLAIVIVASELALKA